MYKLITALVLAILSSSASAQALDISWYTIDGGGGRSAGGEFIVWGTIGQPDAGAQMSGGVFTLDGGFWAGAGGAEGPICPADFDLDGFLTGLDFDLYVTAFEAGEETADFDSDGFITGLDFDGYVAAFEAGC